MALRTSDADGGPEDRERREDEALRELLASVRSIAVIGMKSGEHEEAYRGPRYLQQQGYRILPINPKLDRVLGERAFSSLAQVGEPIDLVNVFRAPRFLADHTREVLALPTPPRGVWFQLGIRNDDAARVLREAGITVVQDRCLMVEHRRLLGKTA